jgi:hypothetical protein
MATFARTTNSIVEEPPIGPAVLALYVQQVTTALAALARDNALAEIAYFLDMAAIVAGDHAAQVTARRDSG